MKNFRKPLFPTLLAFLLLFVSCKQYDNYDENNNSSVYQYSKNDVNSFVTKMLPFKNYIKEQNLSFNNYKEKSNPFEITKNYFLINFQENIIDVNSSDQQAILQILNNKNNYSRSNGTSNNDIFSFIENRGLYSQNELNIIYNFRDNLLSSSDFDTSLNDFNSNITSSNEISLNSKNKLMRLSFMFSTFNSLYPDAFNNMSANNQYRMSAWCVVGLIGLTIAIVGLAEASIAVAAAEVVTEGMLSSVFTSASGYVASLVSAGGCFD